MHFAKYFTLAALVATGALAAPGKASKPAAPSTPSNSNSNSNACANGAEPYCCNTDDSGQYTTCSVLASDNTCSATTVCCNAQDSTQVCLGSAQILS
ncbi:hypothetical protein LTR10_015429 [Elasticomyces elasticus]|uniref:Hydrophobin n=1 Tax=Exophiala sideris TaxID=1016849 RepID=A0ABR0J3V0_9EURO|nr:hypothetical protein LTR10_015429 [Elasticomyces elasticus]KAK5026979.1 hypothetical protein LTS07_007278 [Exophiala sideris]KAK5033983.1 hypothetical protein LTR13_006583 [Exophiala sideris]KAK5055743.1 hypothetical protein LTR69_008118 [Exophiala sideris]KAK5180925.1 hypothetical protein LTR44_006745 [Eurotiomycetes sp. CCFEE 6388]